MGGIAGAAGAGRRVLTRWAFALDEVGEGIDEPTALVLPMAAIDRLPALRGAFLADAAAGGVRSVRRRKVLAALATRALGLPAARLVAGSDGVRRLGGTALFASVAERSGWAAAVVSRAPVGIDLEDLAEAEAGRDAVLDGVDTVDTAAWPSPAAVWAGREAVLKAMGRDLTAPVRGWRMVAGGVTIPGRPPYRLDLIGLPGLHAAVAYVGG